MRCADLAPCRNVETGTHLLILHLLEHSSRPALELAAGGLTHCGFIFFRVFIFSPPSLNLISRICGELGGEGGAGGQCGGVGGGGIRGSGWGGRVVEATRRFQVIRTLGHQVLGTVV